MHTSSTTAAQRRTELSTTAAAGAAVAVAAVVSIVLSIGVAAIAHAAGAADNFKPLSTATFAPLIVVGLAGAALAWIVVRRRARRPARVMHRLAPVVVLLSMIPDVLLGVTDSLAGTSWTAVIGLVVMHLIVAIAGIASLNRFLPLRPHGDDVVDQLASRRERAAQLLR